MYRHLICGKVYTKTHQLYIILTITLSKMLSQSNPCSNNITIDILLRRCHVMNMAVDIHTSSFVDRGCLYLHRVFVVSDKLFNSTVSNVTAGTRGSVYSA